MTPLDLLWWALAVSATIIFTTVAFVVVIAAYKSFTSKPTTTERIDKEN